jgi:hypothetical protein
LKSPCPGALSRSPLPAQGVGEEGKAPKGRPHTTARPSGTPPAVSPSTTALGALETFNPHPLSGAPTAAEALSAPRPKSATLFGGASPAHPPQAEHVGWCCTPKPGTPPPIRDAAPPPHPRRCRERDGRQCAASVCFYHNRSVVALNPERKRLPLIAPRALADACYGPGPYAALACRGFYAGLEVVGRMEPVDQAARRRGRTPQRDPEPPG